MVFSMIIDESFLAHMFGRYTLRTWGVEQRISLIPVFAVGLMMFKRIEVT